MRALLASAALLVTAAAVLAAAGTLLSNASPTVALPVLLDLLLAASLLRLTVQPSPAQLGTTALLVLVKRLASVGIRAASGARAAVRPDAGRSSSRRARPT